MNSQELIERIREGNVDAIIQVQKAVFPNLKQTLQKRRVNTDVADEVCWMAWEAFYNNCQKPDFSLSGNWIGYVYNIGLNIFNKKRERSIELKTETDLNKDDSANFWEQLITEDQPTENLTEIDIRNSTLRKKTFDTCLNYLKEDCRTIFKLAYWENKSSDDIALALQINSATARQRKARCLESIRKRMTEVGIFDELSNFEPLF
jgi:RNA polymerase sigma factor (sigma-70 family)